MVSTAMMIDMPMIRFTGKRRKKVNPLSNPPYPATCNQSGKNRRCFPTEPTVKTDCINPVFPPVCRCNERKTQVTPEIWTYLSTCCVPYALSVNIKRCLTGLARKQWPEKPVCLSRRFQRKPQLTVFTRTFSSLRQGYAISGKLIIGKFVSLRHVSEETTGFNRASVENGQPTPRCANFIHSLYNFPFFPFISTTCLTRAIFVPVG